MSPEELAKGDLLAKQLIDGYWQRLENGKAWNYFNYPPKYVPKDTWATKDQWIAFAKRCLKNKTAIIHAYDILLEAGCDEYFNSAHEYVSRWHKESGHDPEYFWTIISYFEEDDPIRQYWLGYSDPSEFDGGEYNDIVIYPDFNERTVLLKQNDEVMCSFIAAQITQVITEGNEERIEGYAIPMMVQMRGQATRYISDGVMNFIKEFCLNYLEKDRVINPFRNLPNNDERTLWIRGDIALLAWMFGWSDVLNHLKREEWYWNSLTDWYLDSDNSSLLIWSLSLCNDVLLQMAYRVMKSPTQMEQMEGAIAWHRMRGYKINDNRNTTGKLKHEL